MVVVPGCLGYTDLVLRPFIANDLPYDLTDLEMTWLSSSPGAAAVFWVEGDAIV